MTDDNARTAVAGGREGNAAGEWVSVSARKPPLHNQVLVSLKGGPGFVADVACYVGKQDDGAGGQVDRWILADARLETRQITHWAPIFEMVADRLAA